MILHLKALLAIVLSWTPTWYPADGGPETEAERRSRWSMIVETVADVSEQGYVDFGAKDVAALNMTIFKWESALDYHVHGGEESPIGHQDHGKARCLGQIQQNSTPEKEWKALAGRSPEATRRCAVATQRALQYHVKRCKLRKQIPPKNRWREPLNGMETLILLHAYGTGHTCHVSSKKNVVDRLKTYRRLRNAM